jgi:hypothetical protein
MLVSASRSGWRRYGTIIVRVPYSDGLGGDQKFAEDGRRVRKGAQHRPP